jgi:hypothetical protein
LAKYPGGRSNVSFAAKFCHFFVDEQMFHIYDDRACRALRHHLGKTYQENTADRYLAFCNNLARLRDAFQIDAESRSLDRYLWITGSWIKWKMPGTPINAELRALFAQQPRPLDLNEMLPDDLR